MMEIELDRLDYVEEQLNRLIEDRARAAQAANEREAWWAESVKRYSLQRAEGRRRAWRAYHEHMRQVHERLSREHAEKAAKLLEDEDRGEMHS